MSATVNSHERLIHIFHTIEDTWPKGTRMEVARLSHSVRGYKHTILLFDGVFRYTVTKVSDPVYFNCLFIREGTKAVPYYIGNNKLMKDFTQEILAKAPAEGEDALERLTPDDAMSAHAEQRVLMAYNYKGTPVRVFGMADGKYIVEYLGKIELVDWDLYKERE